MEKAKVFHMKYFFIILIFVSAIPIHREPRQGSLFYIWNVGQGQWTTWHHQNYCDHYDMGGEYNLSKLVLQKCGLASHRLHLSHWDWDHLGLLENFSVITPPCADGIGPMAAPLRRKNPCWPPYPPVPRLQLIPMI